MKKFIFLILLILSLTLSIASSESIVNTIPLFGKVIVIDVGHGNADPGSVYDGDYESDYNLDFARTLYKTLQTYGADVRLIRDADYDLSNPNAKKKKRSDFDNRIKIINDLNPDMYISLHMNYISNSKYSGAQTYYSLANDKNEQIANHIQDYLNKYFNYDKTPQKITNDKYMYKKLTPKGILLEFGFMSNYKDRTNLKKETYKEELAKVITKSIIEYFT